MTIDREQREVKKHDAIYLYPRSEQSIKNVGDVDLRFLDICTPPCKKNSQELVSRLREQLYF